MMKTEITADEIVSLLHALGYRAVCVPGDTNLTIHSASQGLEWEIYVGVTDESEASDFLIFSHSRFVSPVQFPVGRICNEFNTISPHGVATFSMDDNEEITEDARVTLDFSISLIGGVADEWLEDSISMWELILGMFDKKVLECKEPTPKDESFS
jgi:hypothetical protein